MTFRTTQPLGKINPHNRCKVGAAAIPAHGAEMHADCPAVGRGAAKRRLLGAPRPPGAIAALPQSALFGSLQPPRLLGGR